MACAKCVGQVEAQSSSKCEGSAVLFFSLSLVNFFKVQVVCEAVLLSLWEIFIRKLSSVFLKHKFVRALLLPTTCVYGGCGFRSAFLSLRPERN